MSNKLQLVVIEPSNGGGLVHYTYQLCTALAHEGIEVTLITGTEYELVDFPHNFQLITMLRLWSGFDNQPAEVGRSVVARFISKAYRLVRRMVRGAKLMMAWIQLTRLVIRVKPDIVQFTRIMFPFEIVFIRFLRWYGFTLTQICHEFEVRERRGLLSDLSWRIAGDVYKYFSAIFFHAVENRTRFLESHASIPEKRTQIIPHGNSGWLLEIPASPLEALKQKYRIKDGEPVVLFFGLLAPSKGVEDLIDAFLIASKSCSAKLVIAGYPTKHINLNDLRERVETHGLTDRVMFDPRYIPLEEIRPLMSLATVVVYPYRSSTQSGALQAAYIFGRPVVATTVGGLPESVEDGLSGFLVPPGSPEKLAEKIITLVNDPALASKMGEYAHYIANTRFSWQGIARKIVGVYETLNKDKVRGN